MHGISHIKNSLPRSNKHVPVHVAGQMKPTHTLTPNLFNIHFVAIPSSTARFSELFIPQFFN